MATPGPAYCHLWYENFIYATILNASEIKVYPDLQIEKALRKRKEIKKESMIKFADSMTAQCSVGALFAF